MPGAPAAAVERLLGVQLARVCDLVRFGLEARCCALLSPADAMLARDR